MTKRGRPRGSRELTGRCVRATRPIRFGPAYAALSRDFGRQLGIVMGERAIAASELAAAIRVSVDTVFAWRRGRSIPAVASLHAVARALGCALADLLPESARYP